MLFLIYQQTAQFFLRRLRILALWDQGLSHRLALLLPGSCHLSGRRGGLGKSGLSSCFEHKLVLGFKVVASLPTVKEGLCALGVLQLFQMM